MQCNVKLVFDPTTRVTWAVRLVRQGERYGLNDSLAHDGDVPLVEFYDTRHGHTDLGQLVSRYSADTIVDSRPHLEGILLETSSPDWQLGQLALARVQTWLRRELATVLPSPSPHKRVFFYNIQWDTDAEEERSLPTETTMEVSIAVEDLAQHGADLLSAKFGFCVESFLFEVVKAPFPLKAA